MAAIPIHLPTIAATFFGPFAHTEHRFIHLLFSLGLFGLFLVSIVDSSFVPLPIPGLTDIMIIVFAAQHANPWLLVAIATAGSALGGLFSHHVGQSGGMAFIEKRTPPKVFKRVTRWMESHAILAVALPAILPPPMPLSPFVLAAGALKMSRKKFMITFTLSRFARHAIAIWLGLAYGRQVLVLWNKFSARWGTTILIVIWVGIAISLAFAFWQLWKTSHSVGAIKKRAKPMQGAPSPKPTVVIPHVRHSQRSSFPQRSSFWRSQNPCICLSDPLYNIKKANPPSKLPLQQRRPHRKPAPKSRQQHQVALLQASLFKRRLHRQRYRPAGRIPILPDVDDDLLLRHPQPFSTSPE